MTQFKGQSKNCMQNCELKTTVIIIPKAYKSLHKNLIQHLPSTPTKYMLLYETATLYRSYLVKLVQNKRQVSL